MVDTAGTMGIFVSPHLACKFLLISLPGKEFVCKILQFSVYINVQDLSVFLTLFRRNLTSELEERFGGW